jgi:hypothetical protein
MNCAKLIRDLMGKGVTQSMIGHHVGISQGAVSQHLRADGKSEIAYSKGEKLVALHRRVCGAPPRAELIRSSEARDAAAAKGGC